MPAITHVPASSPTVSGVTVVTEHVFTQKFTLVPRTKTAISSGAKAGIAVGVIVVCFLTATLALLRLRRVRGFRWRSNHPPEAVAMETRSSVAYCI